MTKGDRDSWSGQHLSNLFFGAKFWLKDRADAEIVALQAPRSAFEPADLLQKLARSMREEPQLRKASNRDRKASLVDRFP